MNSKMIFGKNQFSPKKRKTSLAHPTSDRVIFEVGVTPDSKQANDYEEGKISVAVEAGRGRNLYVGAFQKPVVGNGASPGRGCNPSLAAAVGSSQQRPVAFGGGGADGWPVGLQYLARPSMSQQVLSTGIFQKPLSAATAITIEKPYFSVSSICYLCCKTFEPGDDIFMFQDDYAFCTVDCRELQMDFFEKRDVLICHLNAKRAAAKAGQSSTYNY